MLIDWLVQPLGDGWEDYAPDVVVWVDVARIDAAFARDTSHYVGVRGCGAGQPTRYANIGRRMQAGLPIWMPQLHLHDDGVIRFTDGRHRFAWVRDHGATALPVATSLDAAAILASQFGSPLRECRVR